MSEHDGEDEGGGTVTPIRQTRETSPVELIMNGLGFAAEKVRVAAVVLDLCVEKMEIAQDLLGGDQEPAARKSATNALLVSALAVAGFAAGAVIYARAVAVENKRQRELEAPTGEVKAPETFRRRLGLAVRLIAREARDQAGGAGSSAIIAWRILRGSVDVHTAPERSDAN